MFVASAAFGITLALAFLVLTLHMRQSFIRLKAEQFDASDVVSIGGRLFKTIQHSNHRHGLWMTFQIERAGLHRFSRRHDESAQQFELRVLREVETNNELPLLLAGLLIPVSVTDEGWTPELAHETAEHFARCKDVRSQAVLKVQIASMLKAYCESSAPTYSSATTECVRRVQ